jgi:hypothetical protein
MMVLCWFIVMRVFRVRLGVLWGFIWWMVLLLGRLCWLLLVSSRLILVGRGVRVGRMGWLRIFWVCCLGWMLGVLLMSCVGEDEFRLVFG